MNRRPVILDLFACAGGAGVGYERAGFDVVGVDIDPQPRNPHPCLVADVMQLPVEFLRQFDAIHASPPCQGYSSMRHAKGAKGAPLLIGPVRDMLLASGLPYVIENVAEAAWDLRSPVRLCGSMFDLGCTADGVRYQLQRHRLFETSFPYIAPSVCRHTSPTVGIYGGHVRNRAAKAGGRGTVDFVGHDKPALAREAMQIDWMTFDQMSEALPPAYTQSIGAELLLHLQSRA